MAFWSNRLISAIRFNKPKRPEILGTAKPFIPVPHAVGASLSETKSGREFVPRPGRPVAVLHGCGAYSRLTKRSTRGTKLEFEVAPGGGRVSNGLMLVQPSRRLVC
jgi:hypothetical protein